MDKTGERGDGKCFVQHGNVGFHIKINFCRIARLEMLRQFAIFEKLCANVSLKISKTTFFSNLQTFTLKNYYSIYCAIYSIVTYVLSHENNDVTTLSEMNFSFSKNKRLTINVGLLLLFNRTRWWRWRRITITITIARRVRARITVATDNIILVHSKL